jgi:hypothetical protein
MAKVGVRCRRLLAVLAAGFLLVLCSEVGFAAEVSKRAVLFAKALSYERRLSATKGDSVGIAVLYAANNAASKAAAERWITSFESLGSMTIDGAPVKAAAFSYDPESLRKIIRPKGIDVLIACDGVPYRAVSALAADHAILSAGDTPSGVKDSLSLGVFVGDGKPRIVINMQVAKREGAKFSAKLLQIAEVI